MQKQRGISANRETDPVGWAREESIRFSRAKAKRYGTFMVADLIGFVLVLKDMPAHGLWPVLGPVLGIALVCLTAITGFYLVALLGDRATSSQPPGGAKNH